MNIRFIGSETGLQTFRKLLTNKANVLTDENGRDAIIFEIPSLEVLYKIPKRDFGVPVFFYLTTPNKTVLSNIKDYNISGILFPPLNAAAILSKIERLKNDALKVNNQDFETLRIKIIAKAENIPALPDIAQSLIRLTSSNSQAAVSEITAKIKMDQGISAKVIKLVNSPFYGVRQEIASIDRATMLLGFGSVKNIALAISLDLYYQKPFSMYKTTGQALWQHTYNTALISSEIAKNLGQDEEALYMAGLLHDIGKIVMVDFLVKEVDNILDERNQLGCDHTEVASIMLNKWSVAPAVVEAVKTHHDKEPSMFGKIVAAANSIDNDRDNLDDYLNRLNLEYPLKDIDTLRETIITILSDEQNAENK